MKRQITARCRQCRRPYALGPERILGSCLTCIFDGDRRRSSFFVTNMGAVVQILRSGVIQTLESDVVLPKTRAWWVLNVLDMVPRRVA